VRPPPPALPRREFLVDSGRAVGAALLALELPWVSALAACARADARREAPFTTLNVAEARTMRAFAAQLIPSDETLPGAEEAGAVYFVDRALGSYVKELLPPIRVGLADLDRRARKRGAGAEGFAALPPARQEEVIREIEKSDFFGGARMLVVAGTFADPAYGGNRDGVGWKVLDVDHRPSYQPPFGYYDAEQGSVARGRVS
jgi:hypothetical protein